MGTLPRGTSQPLSIRRDEDRYRGKAPSGMQTCNGTGTAYGACDGQVLPLAEVCGDALDNDCDGTTDEGCAYQTCTGEEACSDEFAAEPAVREAWESGIFYTSAAGDGCLSMTIRSSTTQADLATRCLS